MRYAKYAYRIETRRVKEPDFPYDGIAFNSPDAIAAFTKSLQDSDIEKMIVLYLNAKHKLMGIQIFSGTIDRAVISPREVCKHALLNTAVSIVLVHNHPSGDPQPSPEDKHLVNAIKCACETLDIRLLDNVIVGDGDKRFSFTEAGMLRRGDELPLRSI